MNTERMFYSLFIDLSWIWKFEELFTLLSDVNMMRCRLFWRGSKEGFCSSISVYDCFFLSAKRVKKFKFQNYVLLAFSSCVKNVQFHSQKDWEIKYVDKVNIHTLIPGVSLKVRKSRKKNMLSWILPKNERWDNFQDIKLSQRFFLENRGHLIFSRFTDL